MAKAYVLCEVSINDAERYRAYAAISSPATLDAGGMYLSVGPPAYCIEGAFSADRIVLVEFDSVEAAHTFCTSESYQEAKAAREGGVEMRMLILKGTD